MIYSIDFETRSKIDLADRGLDVYANDPSTEVLCIAYGSNENNVRVIDSVFTQNFPLLDHVRNGGKIQAWNAMFEYAIWNCVCVPKYGWPELKLEQCIDSMAIAAANNIPQSLEEAGSFINSDHQKDPTGKKLIQKLCKPMISKSKDLQNNRQFNEDPELMAQLFEYCRKDVLAEMAIVSKLRSLTPEEQKVWELTQRINVRGVPVDPKELQNAVQAVNDAQSEIDDECVSLTGFKPSERAKLLNWLNQYLTEPLADLTAETVEKMLQRSKLKQPLKRVLELRQEGSQTSVAKYAKMLEVQVGGRIRNTLVYHGASTGRFASRGGLNLQNIARPSLGDDKIKEAVERILVNGGKGTMEELSSLVRSAIKAPDGYVFVDADFSSIENRVASWIAGQDDILELFRGGMDEYKNFASSALYNVPYDEVTKDMRQVSKSAVLGCMFGQGAKGLVEYADGMGVKMTPTEADRAVKAYRSKYAKVKSAWYDFEAQAINAINVPGTAFRSGKVVFKVAKEALWMQLPSGRLICWRKPQVEKQLTPWGAMKDGITIFNQNTFTRKWGRNKLIGSSIFQSAVQATARDMLTEAMLLLEDNGYSVLNCIHDEILLLVPESDGDSALEHVLELMTKPPAWSPEFPLGAEGWVDSRYRK